MTVSNRSVWNSSYPRQNSSRDLLTAGHYAEIELGNRRVNPRMIKLLSTAYGVSETFLKTGTGDMFARKTDPRLDSMIQIFQELPPDFQDYILLQIEAPKKLHKKNSPD